jgi:hypothetical protein
MPPQEIAQLSVRKEQLERQAEATQRKREALLAQIAGLKEVSAEGAWLAAGTHADANWLSGRKPAS